MSEHQPISQENTDDLGQPTVVQNGFHEAKVREYQEHIESIYSVVGSEDAALSKIEEIGRKLEADGPFKGKITYKLIHSSEENAFACGTTVYIYSGLLVALKTESEVAGVIAHELSHIEHGDTTQLNDARRTFWEEVSRGRIQEYLADSVLHKMHQGGYHPAAYERVLQYLAYGQRTVGFTHGASSDRQAAYRAQLHVFDLETTAQPDTSVRPSEFSPDILTPLQQKSTFEEISEGVKSGKIEAILPAIESLKTTSLLILWSEAAAEVKNLTERMQRSSYKRYNNSRERAEDMRALKENSRMLSILNEALAQKVKGLLPQMPVSAQSWLRIILLLNSQGIDLKGFEESMRFAEKKTKISMPKFHAELEQSLTTTDDLVSLARFARTYDQGAATLGVTVDASLHPEAVFKTDASYPYGPEEPDSLFRATLKRALKDEGIKDPLDTLVVLGETLSVFSKNKASQPWFQKELDYYFGMYVKSMLLRFPKKGLKRKGVESQSEALKKLQDTASQAVIRYGAVLTRAGFSGAEPYLLGTVKKEFADFLAKAKVGYREVNAFELGLASSVAEAKREQSTLFKSFSLAASLTPDAQRDYFNTLRFSDLLQIRSMAQFEEVCPDPTVRKEFKKNIIAFLLNEYKVSGEDFARIRLLAERRGFMPRSRDTDYAEEKGETDDADALARFGVNEEMCRLLAALQFETMFGGGQLSDALLAKLSTLWNN